MEVRSCRSCRRLFNYLGGPPLCPACRDELEKTFFTVKEYIRNNPHATIRDVADANEVSVNQIQQWVREERLQFSSDSGVALQCEKCGAKIYTGRYCDKCKAGLANGLTKAFSDDKKHAEPKKQEKTGNKMRFLKK